MSRFAAGLLVLFAVAAAPANAEMRVGGFVGGDPGTAAGQFLQPTDVAVHRADTNDPADDKIFVTEGLERNSRVQRLDGDGNFELVWGRDVLRAGAPGDRGAGYEVCTAAPACKAGVSGAGKGHLARPSGVAVNPSTGDVYVLDVGNGRVQRFSLDGRRRGSWTLDIGGGTGDYDRSAIAVSPSESHDVFVADQGNNRVLQFGSAGRFLRAWGWGVDTGVARFETCTTRGRCRAGRPIPGYGRRARSWPRHIAVDRDGVVYAAVFLGVLFESGEIRTRIVRFRSRQDPEPPSAKQALLAPLRPDKGYWSEVPLSALLTNGTTLGLDVDPTSGRLLAISNPFGTSKLDVIARPAAAGDSNPHVHVEDAFPFLQNVTGLAAAGDGVVLLSSGVVRQLTGTSTFTGCARDDAKRDCHGLIVLAPGGRAGALLAPDPGHGALAAQVDPRGTARYRLQASTDGKTWRGLGRTRQVTGAGYETVPLPSHGLKRGVVHKLRLLVTKRTEEGDQSTVSNERFMLLPRRPHWR